MKTRQRSELFQKIKTVIPISFPKYFWKILRRAGPPKPGSGMCGMCVMYGIDIVKFVENWVKFRPWGKIIFINKMTFLHYLWWNSDQNLKPEKSNFSLKIVYPSIGPQIESICHKNVWYDIWDGIIDISNLWYGIWWVIFWHFLSNFANRFSALPIHCIFITNAPTHSVYIHVHNYFLLGYYHIFFWTLNVDTVW